MTFKNYLLEKEDSSRKMWSWLGAWRLPISPKFFEDNFQNKEQYCFMAINMNRIPSLYKRQNKKNQMSTFTEFRNTNIFWGAGNLAWKGWNPNNETIVAVLKGKVTIQGNSDVWSFPEEAGRRWIDINNIKRYGTDLTSVLTSIQTDIKVEFTKKLPNLKLENITWHLTPKGNISWQNADKKGKDFQKIFKLYFDCSYEALKKYKKELKGIDVLAPKAKYNEHLCYDYKVQELLVISENPKNTLELYPDLQGKQYRFLSPKEVQAELQKYKNKG